MADLQRLPGRMIWASCPHCGRYRTLDLNALAQRFGRAAKIAALKPLLRCSRCGRAGRLSIGATEDYRRHRR
ncbi:MAG TPA: hypothetical protein VKY65_14570 [Alphaproteobacteria bacterium]|nr:hypothetical protein [Alphaproteobacteria bacterium]